MQTLINFKTKKIPVLIDVGSQHFRNFCDLEYDLALNYSNERINTINFYPQKLSICDSTVSFDLVEFDIECDESKSNLVQEIQEIYIDKNNKKMNIFWG